MTLSISDDFSFDIEVKAGSEILYDRDKKIHLHFAVEINMGQLKFEELSFKANFYDGLNVKGGTLYIREDTAVFKVHMYNISDLSEKVIPISEICGYKKGLFTILTIFLTNGKKVKLAVWKKDAIIKALEERRHTIYRRLGKKIPQLSMF